MKDKIIEILDRLLSHLTINYSTKALVAIEIEALYQPRVDKLKEIIKCYDELKYYQFRTDRDIDEAIESRNKMLELKNRIEQLKKRSRIINLKLNYNESEN